MTDVAISPVLRAFGAEVGERLGHGGEATVYALGEDRVLRVFHRPPDQLQELAAFYERLDGAAASLDVPRVLEHGNIDGETYSIDRRMPGAPLSDVLVRLRGDDRARALDAYMHAAEHVRLLSPEGGGEYGDVFYDNGAMLRRDTWTGYLHARVAQELTIAGARLREAVPELNRALAALSRMIDALPERPAKSLVHGDYFPPNVMADERGITTGVIDFGGLTVIGDATMDLASAVIFLEMQSEYEPDDTAHAMGWLVSRYGAEMEQAVRAYRGFYAVRLAHCADDERLCAWCVAQMRELAAGA